MNEIIERLIYACNKYKFTYFDVSISGSIGNYFLTLTLGKAIGRGQMRLSHQFHMNGMELSADTWRALGNPKEAEKFFKEAVERFNEVEREDKLNG